ncbi:MAG: glycoside hydrolase family 3 [Ruminococcus sp.]|uniref:glycoside hydrolase family 3 N-terminal domain-containing protein n=1 Tax=Ruminococcus sp. TaxID=41978 RepID=UPI0025F9B8E9|nr:glycoside hydrolase family 3 N-terminal domain-containing protein [Ruminococcus sp.]MCR5539812.1 glycoside hydrolase family 3 [Ruminococcus sp.]
MKKIITAILITAALLQALPVYADTEIKKGDVNFDGKINITDITRTAAHIKGKRILSSNAAKAADVNSDDVVNITDITMIAAHIKGKHIIGSQDTQPVYETKAEEKLAQMTLHQKVCQMFITTPEGLTGQKKITTADSTMDKALKKYPIGGFILFDYNLTSVSQTKSLISNSQKYNKKHSDIPLFIAVDEEGGTVARCAKKLGTTPFQSMYAYKDMGTNTAYNNAWTIANDISKLGFNLDFAPVADTWSNPNNTVIGRRAYSDNFNQTAKLISSAVKGFNDGGVTCTLKHFPGHGDTATDSHVGMACSYKTIDQLEKQEYAAFKSGIKAGADMVMVGHITMSNIDGLPATISPKMVNGELRKKLGFKGVIITDGLGMGAVANYYSSSDLAVKCVQAGDDILLIPADLKAAVNGIEDAVAKGTITEERINESVLRILSLKEKRGLL